MTRLVQLICFCLLAAGLRANPVLQWNALMIDAIRIDNSGPTLSSRNLAILHVAIYDAVNSISNRFQPYQIQLIPPAACSQDAAATGAAHEVMNALYPGMSARSDELFETFIAQSPQDAAITNGISFGIQIAQMALNNRAGDGASTDVPYIPNYEAGNWLRTPPFFRPPLTPQWRYVDLFALPDVARFTPKPPPALNSPEYAAALNEVKTLGARNSSTRTAEQSQIATFWSDFSYTAMPPGHWHLIAEGIAYDRALSVEECARLFALVSLGQADSSVICWEAKFRYNLWRPGTAIQRANEDNNPATDADPEWASFLNSPPFPAYTSGHSSFSMASAEIIGRYFGTDTIHFVAASDSLPGVFRQFNSLKACADEIGMSRIYGGIHFAFDNIEGKKCGAAIGQYISKNYLLPNTALPWLVIEGLTNSQLQLRLHGRIGTTIALETSLDLKSWIQNATHQSAPGGIPAVQSANDTVFFRLREAAP